MATRISCVGCCASWSRENLLRDHGAEALAAFGSAFPDLAPHAHFHRADLDRMLDRADVVIVHEWNEPALIAAIGQRRRAGARFTLLFHDTHHRVVSDPDAMRRLDLSGYDGVLAFGAVLADIYRRCGWGARAFVWHEAADTRLFRPPVVEGRRQGVVWIGNWGDDERSDELRAFLFRPISRNRMRLDVHGVRYPDHAVAALQRAGARYRGWLPNARVPEVFARHMLTVHVPRRFYAEQLPGIPTIRMFEALACGIPLVSAPWQDCEGLFRARKDYLQARTPAEMGRHMRALRADRALRRSLAAHGLETIHRRHTCTHRVDELLTIVDTIRAAPKVAAA